MITYRCDRCGTETSPDKLYEVEFVSTPRSLEGGMDSDKAEWTRLGDLCGDCCDAVEVQARALVKPPKVVGLRVDTTTFGGGRSSLDVVATEGGKASVETKS